MNFYDRIISRTRSKKKPLKFLAKWIAESQSCYSQTAYKPKFWFPSISKARDALCAIFLAQFIPYWETAEVFQRMGQLAYQNRYSGRWESVQLILERIKLSTNSQPELNEMIWLEMFQPREFYGNFLQQVELFLMINRETYRSYEKHSRVKRKVRRRGYQDKGSLRPPWQKHRTFPDPNPGIDRRNLVSHPLLLENCGEGAGGTSRPQGFELKGGEEDVICRQDPRRSSAAQRSEDRNQSTDLKASRSQSPPQLPHPKETSVGP